MMKGDRMAKRSSFGSIVRKRLSDITNSIPQAKSPNLENGFSQTDSSAKEYTDHLVKENMALAKLLADKNKIIELTGKELQNIRIYLQKMQQQNWNLAQSNSHLLAELNLGKEKLKSLQHDIACKDALLKAKNFELEENKKVNCQKNCSQMDGKEAVAVEENKCNDDGKPFEGHRRRGIRSQSMGPSSTSQQVAEKEPSENKRRCLRRQSARFRSQQQEPIENLFEIEGAKFPVGGALAGPISEEERDENGAPRFETQQSERTSLSRPLRKAAEKIQSYKEIPLNVKMRRSQ